MAWRPSQPTKMVSSRVTLLMASPRPLKEAMEEEEDHRVTDTLSSMVIVMVAVIISNILKIMKYCNNYL